MSTPLEMIPDIDLGCDHYLVWLRWAPDDTEENRKWLKIRRGRLPVVDKWGALIRHYRADGFLCEGAITFDGEWQRRVKIISEFLWKVECWNPLTITPSLLCQCPTLNHKGEVVGKCGDHGNIIKGKWVPI